MQIFSWPTPRQAHFCAAPPFRLFEVACDSSGFGRLTGPPRPPQGLFCWHATVAGGGRRQSATHHRPLRMGRCSGRARRANWPWRHATGGGSKTRRSGATAPADSPAADWFGAQSPTTNPPARARGSANAWATARVVGQASKWPARPGLACALGTRVPVPGPLGSAAPLTWPP